MGSHCSQKEKDLELTAHIGKELLTTIGQLEARVADLEGELRSARDHVTQLRHELNAKTDLLQVNSWDKIHKISFVLTQYWKTKLTYWPLKLHTWWWIRCVEGRWNRPCMFIFGADWLRQSRTRDCLLMPMSISSNLHGYWNWNLWDF